MSAGDFIFEGPPRDVHSFTSGSVELEPGMIIQGATSGATAILEEVLIQSGSWGGGNAAGYLVLRPGTREGTFQAENIGGTFIKDVPVDDNHATIATRRIAAVAVEAACALAEADEEPKGYFGGTDVPRSNSAGFTIGGAATPDNELHFWQAWAGD